MVKIISSNLATQINTINFGVHPFVSFYLLKNENLKLHILWEEKKAFSTHT